MSEIPDKARQLLEQARGLNAPEQDDEAISLYQQAIQLAPGWAAPHYNLGLIYKYRCEWQLSFTYNKKATELDSQDEASHWNLGIAATALKEWRTARKAWNVFGLNLDINDNETNLDLGQTPVRLNPDSNAEVVWCSRIDPARTRINNVPLPESGHRYGDLLLNDGAPVGERISDGRSYPVFNELQLLEKSAYKTFSAVVYTNNKTDMDKLAKLCLDEKIGFEDWSTIRLLCKKCCEGTPHEHHDHDRKITNEAETHIGFGATNKQILQQILRNWAIITLAAYSGPVLELE